MTILLEKADECPNCGEEGAGWSYDGQTCARCRYPKQGGAGSLGLSAGRGTEVTDVKIGGITELYGDPARKPEKPYTIILFPGGSVEISRCTNGSYWIHVATDIGVPGGPKAAISEARIDATGRYCEATNAALAEEIARGAVNHIAFLIGKPPL